MIDASLDPREYRFRKTTARGSARRDLPLAGRKPYGPPPPPPAFDVCSVDERLAWVKNWYAARDSKMTPEELEEWIEKAFTMPRPSLDEIQARIHGRPFPTADPAIKSVTVRK